MVNTLGNNSEAPQKVSAIKGLSAKIVAALAALGIATSAEKVEGATILLGTGLSHSTISAPAKISGLANEATPLVGTQNSFLVSSNRAHSDISTSAFTINLNSVDVGTGGFLTITGKLNMSTSSNFDIENNPGAGYAGLGYQLIQKVKWGNNTNSMTQIGNTFDSGLRSNDDTPSFTTGEAWTGTQDFTATIPISAAGTYYLGNEFTRTETSGGASLNEFTMSYTAIPEPSTGLIAGGLLGAALLRRRRENKNSQ